jgi:acyl-CoA thioesterase-2
MAAVELDAILRCLEVTESSPGTWTAPNLEMDYRRVFGGQLLAQAIAVATASAEGKTVKSLSCLFPREGSLDEPFGYELEESQTGRAFAARRMTAAQNGKVFFLAQASLHVAEDAHDHQDHVPDLGAPDDATPEDMGMIPWETRVVGGVDLQDRSAGPADYAFWTRVGHVGLGSPDEPLGELVHQALLAYATDLTVIGTAMRPLDGVSQADAHVSLHTAVTAHHMWFHRPFRIDDWCLVTQHVPTVAGARAFGTGTVFDTDGRLVANFAQESMIRPLAQE